MLKLSNNQPNSFDVFLIPPNQLRYKNNSAKFDNRTTYSEDIRKIFFSASIIFAIK